MATATVINGPAGGFARNSPHHALHMSTTMPCQLLSAQHNISTLRARTRAALDHLTMLRDTLDGASSVRWSVSSRLRRTPLKFARIAESDLIRVDAPRKKFAPFHSV